MKKLLFLTLILVGGSAPHIQAVRNLHTRMMAAHSTARNQNQTRNNQYTQEDRTQEAAGNIVCCIAATLCCCWHSAPIAQSLYTAYTQSSSENSK